MTLPCGDGCFVGGAAFCEKIGLLVLSNWSLPLASRPLDTAAAKSSLGRFGVNFPGAASEYGLRRTAVFVLLAVVVHGAVSPTANIRMPSAPAARALCPCRSVPSMPFMYAPIPAIA